MSDKNYFISSFAWSTASKIFNAILGFISIPLLLGYYGKIEYGLLSIATACNGYMALLDLGMNTGAVKFYSQWKAEGKFDVIFKVAKTNISFYLIIACINIALLIILALFGRTLFSITYDQFLQLRTCLLILALFSLINWETTVFNQLLIANKQMAFTMKIQCLQVLLKGLAILLVFIADLRITTYFFYLTASIAFAIIPYAYKCKKDNLIDNFRPAWYWNEFKTIITFCLSIFALSIFQMTATQSRPILLSMFSTHGASTVADFRILEVIPQFIIMIGGTVSGIFLPKTSEMVARNDKIAMQAFAYKWTTYTTILLTFMCFPFIICSKEILSAYVGVKYSYLAKWLVLWCVTVLIQMHTTPGNALVLAYGKTKLLVKVTAVACVSSMIVNVCLCKYLDVGSAVIAYFLYVVVIIGLYYISFYKKLLKLSRWNLFLCFAKPTSVAIFVSIALFCIPMSIEIFGEINERFGYVLICIIKSLVWIVLYVVMLSLLKIVDIKKIINKNENLR